MLKTSKVTLKVVEAIKDSKKSIINALNSIASEDNDFNGDNGKEFLWEEAKEKGFNSNMEYVESIITGYTSQAIVYQYLNNWLGRDYYYQDYEYEIVEYPNNDSIIIIVAFTIDN